MTRRERLERKLERREEWAGKAQARGEARLESVRKLADAIPFGQPILVGHHSERHARRDQERIHDGMAKGVELLDKAKHHSAKADGLARQLDQSVFSDDPDAVEALEARIAKAKEKRAAMVEINALFRRGNAEALKSKYNLDLAVLQKAVEGHYSWDKQPYAKYELTNLGARIRSDAKRLEEIKRRRDRVAKAEAAGGVVVDSTGEWSRVTFAEKPDRSVLDALRAAGYSWGGGSWIGKTADLPAEIGGSK